MTIQETAIQAFERHRHLCARLAACDAPMDTPVRDFLARLSERFQFILDFLDGTDAEVDASLGYLCKLTDADHTDSIVKAAFPKLRSLLVSTNKSGVICLICGILIRKKEKLALSPADIRIIRQKAAAVVLNRAFDSMHRRWCYIFFWETYGRVDGPRKLRILEDDSDAEIDLDFVRKNI